MDKFEKYIRQIELEDFGEVGQRKLALATVALIGVGGVGSAVLPLLVGAGIGKIAIFDCDKVSSTNLHRQTIYPENSIGHFKAEFAADYSRERNSDCKVDYFCERFTEESSKNIKFDICIDATDSFTSRKAIAVACRQMGVRVVGASAEGFISQNFLFGDGFYFDDIVSAGSTDTSSKGVAIFPAAAHLSGVWAASEVIKSIVFDRFEVGAFKMFDSLSSKYFSGNIR